MKQYQEFLKHILEKGITKSDRTGTGTFSTFGYQMRFNLLDGFPLVTTKKVHWKSVVAELLWFLSGSTNNNDLEKLGCTIWREWQNDDGDLGPVYGRQWVHWPASNGSEINQIKQVIDSIRSNPDSRRHVVSAWNVAELDQMALMPCHALFQFYVANGRLSCQLYQRSADAFLGVPFNIASYALLTHMVAQQCNMEVGEFIWTGGDCHIYSNHIDQVNELLSRTPVSLPHLSLQNKKSIFEYGMEDVFLGGYSPHPAIPAPVAV